MAKGVERKLRSELEAATAKNEELQKRLKVREEELVRERNERLAWEATAESYAGWNQRARRDLRGGR